MKNFSIHFKLFFWSSILVIFVILTIYLLNTTVLDSYYLHYKEKNLGRKYLNAIYINHVGNTINVNEHKENENPNKISIIKQRVYKNKNNILGGFYNINSNFNSIS